MTEDNNTFFMQEDGEVYWGFGHLDRAEFAAKVNGENDEMEPGGWDVLDAGAVQHLWAVWTDGEPHESWRVVNTGTPDAFAVTRCAYDGHQVVVQSNRPQPPTRRDARIAALEAKLAERDEALVVAWRLCLQEAWADLREHLGNRASDQPPVANRYERREG